MDWNAASAEREMQPGLPSRRPVYSAPENRTTYSDPLAHGSGYPSGPRGGGSGGPSGGGGGGGYDGGDYGGGGGGGSGGMAAGASRV